MLSKCRLIHASSWSLEDLRQENVGKGKEGCGVLLVTKISKYEVVDELH